MINNQLIEQVLHLHISCMGCSTGMGDAGWYEKVGQSYCT